MSNFHRYASRLFQGFTEYRYCKAFLDIQTFLAKNNTCERQCPVQAIRYFGDDRTQNIDYDYNTYKPEIKCEGKPKVAFICVHNSCRSQIAEALGKLYASDVVIFMGCNVSCPDVPSQYAENWGLDDPTGKSDEEFEAVIRTIKENVEKLILKLNQ